MKTNEELLKDVQDELTWEPVLSDAEIGVAAHHGVITLTGKVDSYSKKLAAERAVKRVAGVKAVAEEIEVHLSDAGKRTDTELAGAVLSALKWHSIVPDDRLKIAVEHGWVTLEGELDWQFQKDSARDCIENLYGVKGVRNRITIKPRLNSKIVKDGITRAFHRNASLDASNIIVEITGNKVTLRGTVNSWNQRKAAENAAWNAPGVIRVEDEISVIS